MSPLLRTVHLAALAAYLVSTVWLLLVLPAIRRLPDPAEQRRRLARHLRPYNVLSVGAVGVLIISGASALTDLKALYGPAYTQLLWPLTGKLMLTFLLTMVATYLSFGLAHRLVRAEQGKLPVDAGQIRSMLGRLRGGAWLALAVALWTSWAGHGLAARVSLGTGSTPRAHVASP
jgi:hypothetical protein